MGRLEALTKVYYAAICNNSALFTQNIYLYIYIINSYFFIPIIFGFEQVTRKI